MMDIQVTGVQDGRKSTKGIVTLAKTVGYRVALMEMLNSMHITSSPNQKMGPIGSLIFRLYVNIVMIRSTKIA